MTGPGRLLGSVVFALAFQTWADAVGQDMSWSADRMVQNLHGDRAVPELVVADPFRSHLGRLRHRPHPDTGLPADPTRTFVRPFRLRRRDPVSITAAAREYRRLERWLAARRPDGDTVLVTCHPVLAAVADPTRWADVVYYGWDDWAAYPPFQHWQPVIEWSYRQMATRDVNVIGVTPAIVDRIAAERGTVVPNGIRAADYDDLGPIPAWFRDLTGPVALYAGSLESRIDVEALARLAHDLPQWNIVLVGYPNDLAWFADLVPLPNVLIRPPEPRPSVLHMMQAADVCLVPHRWTQLSVAMSPLKLYEYLGAGTPVVASDLPPMRGISERCLLVQPGTPLAPAVLEAAALPTPSPEEVTSFRARHDWAQRYQHWRRAALGG